MKKENLYEPFHIFYRTLDKCPKMEHQHNFFELVYVISGTGKQFINKSSFSYQPRHMFLLTPEDSHSFEIETTTEFFFLQFNDIWLKNSGLLTDNVKRLEFILQNASHQPGCILCNKRDKDLVESMVDAIKLEFDHHDIYDKELIQQLVNTMIIIVARNIAMLLPGQMNMETEEKAMDILQYIQRNIYSPEKLKAGTISNSYGISETYLGKYFKKHVNETLQQYITNYKTKLIEHRLQFSDKRLNEIADEFGFTDESHFNKYFRKQKTHSPKEFRKLIRLTQPDLRDV